jgi:RNA polymerase sigma factor (sigma-70 family)
MDDNDDIHVQGSGAPDEASFMGSAVLSASFVGARARTARGVSSDAVGSNAVASRASASRASASRAAAPKNNKRSFSPRRPAPGSEAPPALAPLADYTRLARGREAELVQQIAELRQDLLALALEAAPVLEELSQLRREVSRGDHALDEVLDLRGADASRDADAFESFCDEAARFHDAIGRSLANAAREGLRQLLVETPLGELTVMRLLGALRPATVSIDADREEDVEDLDSEAPELPPELAGRLRVAERRLRHAEGRFVAANQGLVAIVVKRYLGMGLGQSDLMQEGNIGLLRAVEKFDHRRGCRFSTYATWWIRQGVRRALANQARTIRLPVHAADARYALRQASNKMEARLGRVPSPAELAEQTGIDLAMVSKLMNLVSEPVSLEAPRGDEGDVFLLDSLSDPAARDPAEQAHERDIKSKLERLVEVLTPREARIVRLRYGLDGRDERTLDEIGLEFSVTRERVRQLLGRALDKLRGAASLTPADA